MYGESVTPAPVNAQGAKFSSKNKPKAILIKNWKPFEKNTLRGFLDLLLPSGLILRGCTFHMKDGARQRFQGAACEALDKFWEAVTGGQ
ncbi:MAG: hypothetical protein QOD95_1455 [Gammaproteobacteria bacterium]|jgi:hypothetical protein|nr:hypothetical protein [Gammaproteobacteria bacterium]